MVILLPTFFPQISQSMNSLEKLVHGGENWKGKIVFNPRICGNVELEVGKLIRIYPPWYELINPPFLISFTEPYLGHDSWKGPLSQFNQNYRDIFNNKFLSYSVSGFL